MKDCCRQTYKTTLEEVILHIKRLRGAPIASILAGLEHAVKILKEDEALQISHQKWKERN